MKTADFGSVSSGTMRQEDLIPDFVSVLRDLAEGDEYGELIAEAEAWASVDEDGDSILDELFDALNEAAPAYAYFGSHPGDGADYGFWLSESFEEDFDGLRVDDTSEVPADYVGEILHISDHGNPTLYAKDEGSAELREIWALV